MHAAGEVVSSLVKLVLEVLSHVPSGGTQVRQLSQPAGASLIAGANFAAVVGGEAMTFVEAVVQMVSESDASGHLSYGGIPFSLAKYRFISV